MDVRQLADRVAVEEIIYRYPHCLDTGRFAEVATEIFTEDAELAFGDNVMRGGKAIADALAGYSTTLRACSHNVTNLVIHVDGDSAQATYRILGWHWFVRADGDLMAASDIMTVGGYNDRLIRTPAGWRVHRRAGFMQGNGVGVVPPHMAALSTDLLAIMPAWPA